MAGLNGVEPQKGLKFFVISGEHQHPERKGPGICAPGPCGQDPFRAQLAHKLDIDPVQAEYDKIKKNAEKYPAFCCRAVVKNI